MKSIIYLFVVVLAVSACKKDYEGDTYNFSNSLAPYVELKSKSAINTKEDSTIRITVQMRSALQEPVDVNYAISNGFNSQGTIRIEKNTLENSVSVKVPIGTIPAPRVDTVAEVKLVSAKAVTSGTPLTVGRTGIAKEKIAVKIRK